MATTYQQAFQNLLLSVEEGVNGGWFVDKPHLLIKNYYLLGYYIERRLVTHIDIAMANNYYNAAARISLTPIYKILLTYAEQFTNAEAYFICGWMCEKGGFLAVASQHYNKAANLGDRDAQFELGRIFELGGCNLQINLDEAQKYYIEALKQGHPYAKTYLSEITQKKQAMFERERQYIQSNSIVNPGAKSNQINASFFSHDSRSFQSENKNKYPILSTITPLPEKSYKQKTSPQKKSNNTKLASEHISEVYRVLIESIENETISPEAKKQAGEDLKEKLDILWNAKQSFYITADIAHELYGSIQDNDSNPFAFYSKYINTKLCSLIQDNNFIGLKEALKLITHVSFKRRNRNNTLTLSHEVAELYYQPWQVAFRLALFNDKEDVNGLKVEACALLLKYSAFAADPSIYEKLKQLAGNKIHAIQIANEKLMDDVLILDLLSIPELLMWATKPIIRGSASEYLNVTYQQLYSRDEFKPILDVIGFAMKGLHDLAYNSVLPAQPYMFKIFVDELSSTIQCIKFTSTATFEGVYTYGNNSHQNAVYIGLGDYQTDPKNVKGTLIHELTHAVMLEVYKNKCKPYSVDDEETENRMHNICNRLQNKMNQSNFPKIFKGLFTSYGQESWSRELIARTAEYLSNFDDERSARNALVLLDDDLYSFYFKKCLPEVNDHINLLRIKAGMEEVTYVVEESNIDLRDTYQSAIVRSAPQQSNQLFWQPPNAMPASYPTNYHAPLVQPHHHSGYQAPPQQVAAAPDIYHQSNFHPYLKSSYGANSYRMYPLPSVPTGVPSAPEYPMAQLPTYQYRSPH